MTFEDFRKLCEQRHSIREYTDEAIAEDRILALLETAQLAPNIENTQPWRFHIIYNPDLLAHLMESSCYGDFIVGAGAFIIVSCDTTAWPTAEKVLWNPKELEYSCVIAMEHILLGATAMGLGGTWVSLHHGTAHELLSLPRTEKVVGGLMLGHPGKKMSTGKKHDRVPVKERCTWHD